MLSFGALALAEFLGLLAGWLIFKITSRWFPPLHLVVKYIDQMSQAHAAVSQRR